MSDSQSIKAALDRAARTVTLRPERGQRVYCNRANLGDGTLCRVEEGGHVLTLDVGKAVGGNDAGPSPSMILRSAMSGCVAIGVRQWAARRDVPIDEVEVLLETDVDARGQLGVGSGARPGFEGVRLKIAVTSPSPASEIEDLVATSLKYSPLMDVFLNRHTVERELSVSEPSTTPRQMELQ